MKVEELRKHLKKNRLSTVGKKSILQERLAEFIESQKDVLNEPIVEEMPEDEALQNTTVPINGPETGKSIHESTPTIAVNIVLDEEKKNKILNEYDINVHDFEVPNRSHRSTKRQSLRTSAKKGKEPIKEMEEKENRGETPSRQISVPKTPSKITERFAAIHNGQINKMETLREYKDRLKKRHNELTGNVPNSIKRLATPKSVKTSKRTPWKVEDPAKMDFKFGDVDTSEFLLVASKKTTPVAIKNASPRKLRRRPQTDVKTITKSRIPRNATMKVIPTTVPDETTFVNYLATPKNSTPSRVPCRQQFTPHTGKFVFVDTTKLSDREFQLALEDGLIPGKLAKEKK
ncbi:unnamed protein product [Caenorhabditis bovis]|uniref:SAP domain-containing protein n=1 Tax=Caenorhabditis bovis TaxID=2654633 RepID=A0A8S1F7Y6_9PELO|nr:unnamed protein product [Caenorhabditis bovis]